MIEDDAKPQFMYGRIDNEAASAMLRFWVCARCPQKLMRLHLAAGTVIEVKCPRCGLIQTLVGH